VLDSIEFDRRGIPAVAICTDPFRSAARSMARVMGIPDYRVAFTAHPIGGLSGTEVAGRARALLPDILEIVTGEQANG